MLRRFGAILAALLLLGGSSAGPPSQQPADAVAAPHASSPANQSADRTSEVVGTQIADEVIAHYTRELAWFTGGLVAVGALSLVVSAVSIFFLIRADNRAAEAASRAAQAADIANSQMLLTGRQADILERQQGLAREEFFIVHRPRLAVRDVFYSAADNFGEISFEIANAGDTLAIVTRGFVSAEFVPDSRVFKDWSRGDRELLTENGFRAGQVRPFAIRIDDGTQQALQRMKRKTENPEAFKADRRYSGVMPPTDKFYVFGGVEYTDLRGEDFGTKYTSVFRRVWDPETESFCRTGGDDDEYST
jgi:hypothetical protein